MQIIYLHLLILQEGKKHFFTKQVKFGLLFLMQKIYYYIPSIIAIEHKYIFKQICFSLIDRTEFGTTVQVEVDLELTAKK